MEFVGAAPLPFLLLSEVTVSGFRRVSRFFSKVAKLPPALGNCPNCPSRRKLAPAGLSTRNIARLVTDDN